MHWDDTDRQINTRYCPMTMTLMIYHRLQVLLLIWILLNGISWSNLATSMTATATEATEKERIEKGIESNLQEYDKNHDQQDQDPKKKKKKKKNKRLSDHFPTEHENPHKVPKKGDMDRYHRYINQLKPLFSHDISISLSYVLILAGFSPLEHEMKRNPLESKVELTRQVNIPTGEYWFGTQFTLAKGKLIKHLTGDGADIRHKARVYYPFKMDIDTVTNEQFNDFVRQTGVFVHVCMYVCVCIDYYHIMNIFTQFVS